MDYLIDKKFEFIRDTQTSLYSWCIREHDENGAVDLIPYGYSIFFTATSIQCSRSSSIGEEDKPDSRIISATMRTGSPYTDHLRNGRPWIGVIGSSRVVKDVTIKLCRAKDGEDESCVVYAGIKTIDKYERQYDQEDFIEIYVTISQERFDHMESLALSSRPVRMLFRFSIAEGFYAEWSPDPHFAYIKFLTREKPHAQPEVQGDQRPFPVVGKVGEFSVSIHADVPCMDKE
ncbi:hypothetical protein [Pseudotabrizicola algicola]|uniref:Uncharacterized protein n=1 Tax=Pseudotabrizicola algicola TaxID=2709381 RepID=A0A6B3RII3_9RHOB|nr:hypothetical protein [Pseudotabrizicola algicola]NEX45847.1 hypothetical protein [Pseudotabrizicola algicola]